MVSDVVVGSAIRNTVNSINRTQEAFDRTSLRLATGLRVNSALESPQNFFAAQSLQQRAADLSRLLDGIGQSTRVVQEALIGVETVEQLLNQAESVAQESLRLIQSGQTDPAIFQREVNSSPSPLSSQILSSSPDVYFRLNEASGAFTDIGTAGANVTANNLGGSSQNAAPLYTNGAAPSVDFDGVNDRIQVADSTLINLNTTPARTIEVVFNADTTAGRQVIYEEGAGVNGLTIYIDNGSLFVTGEDDQGAQRFANININAPINAGQTYHAALVFDGAAGTFAGFLDGVEIGSVNVPTEGVFPSHSGNIGIGAAVDGVQFHDGEAGAGFNFDGRISDVAIHNRALPDFELLSHATSLNATTSLQSLNENFNTILEQIDRVVIDAHYRGINLLDGDDLTTFFNEDNTSSLLTDGADFRSLDLGLIDRNFDTVSNIQRIIDAIRPALLEVREYGRTLTNDFAILTNRQTFTEQTINSLRSGADDLTVADQNKEGADLLATQTRLSLGQTSLSLAAQSQASILSLVT